MVLRKPSLFCAGGITNCPNWPVEFFDYLKDSPLTIFNPRRIAPPAQIEEQIIWEHKHLHAADMISFWFPKESICPITLYELGVWFTKKSKPVFVGLHPEYQRRIDIEVQAQLEAPYIKLVYSLQDLAKQILDTLR
jgi:hypothetical protein